MRGGNSVSGPERGEGSKGNSWKEERYTTFELSFLPKLNLKLRAAAEFASSVHCSLIAFRLHMRSSSPTGYAETSLFVKSFWNGGAVFAKTNSRYNIK